MGALVTAGIVCSSWVRINGNLSVQSAACMIRFCLFSSMHTIAVATSGRSADHPLGNEMLSKQIDNNPKALDPKPTFKQKP